ncbi:hypothetical protein GEV33_008366 [Tenebrio molitor]|uniref:Uncharacterized protein n=1 Tax=Tenebrio molitor TaxID=7067 RepID=A0A8J6HGX8_TENMO|nr:hypothetical protein GEV33_008366 [Tenebrio molitor]
MSQNTDDRRMPTPDTGAESTTEVKPTQRGKRKGSRTFQNGLSDPDFRYRSRRNYEKWAKGGRFGGVFPVQQVLANPWRKSVSAGGDVDRVLQPYAAANQGFVNDPTLRRIKSSPCWAAVIPQDPTGEPDLTPDSLRPRTPKSRSRRVEGRKDPEDLPWIRTA